MRQTADPSLLLVEEKLLKEEQRLLDAKAQLISSGVPPAARTEVETELIHLRSRYEALQAQINSGDRFDDLFRATSPGFSEIREHLVDSDNVLIEYALGARQSYVWLLSSDRFQVFKLPPKEQVDRSARRLLALASKPQKGDSETIALQEATADLSRMIIEPVSKQLTGRRLIIVADGILQYVPFQILTSSSHRALIDNHEIVYAASAATLATVKQSKRTRQSGSKLIAAFGDPRFQTDFVAQTAQQTRGTDVENSETLELGSDDNISPANMQRLFFAKAELAQLRSFTQGDGSVIYSDFNATRANLKNLNLTEYRILHFATHGFFNSRQPDLSGLVLSHVDAQGQRIDGFVGLSDIYKLRAPVDLVVLSACRTGLGKEIRGEGLVGLTRGFMYAGASTVVASLWKVDDEATAELMKRFYTNMLERSMTPAAALRDAQNSIRREPQWSSPYFWAAFTLQGDYNQVIQPAEPKASKRYLLIVGVVALILAMAGWYEVRRRRIRKNS